MHRVELGKDENGGDKWVEVREAREVPERFRRAIFKPLLGNSSLVEAATKAQAFNASDVTAAMGGDDIDGLLSMPDLATIAIIKAWSWGEVTVDVLLDMPGEDYDELVKLGNAYLKELDQNAESTEPTSDPKAPTAT